jgi:hypothetical protein
MSDTKNLLSSVEPSNTNVSFLKKIVTHPVFWGIIIGIILSLGVYFLYIYVLIPMKESDNGETTKPTISNRPRLPSYSTTPANLRI